MDISILSKNSIKIKGKSASLIFAMPSTESALSGSLKTKTPADAVLLLSRAGEFDTGKVENQRVLIKGPGDYEISGAKISSFSSNDDVIYTLIIDNLEIVLTTTDALKRVKEKVNGDIVVLYANSDVDQSLITAVEPRIAVFYGEKAKECITLLGKEAKPVPKLSVTAEKLPAELETIYFDS